MVDSTAMHRWLARLAFAGRCPRPPPCPQQGVRPASLADSTIRTPRKRHIPVESTISSPRARLEPGSGPRGERPDACAGLRHVLIGVVGGAHERTRGDVVEAELVGGSLE